MKLPSFLALNASHRAIGLLHVGGSIQRYPDGKTPRPPTSNDLNGGDGLAAGPMPDGAKALFPESHVVYADCLGFHHAVGPALNAADYAPTALLSKSKESCAPPRGRLVSARIWRPGCAPPHAPGHTSQQGWRLILTG